MDALQKPDVPYGNDWDSAAEPAAYGDWADKKRPWRSKIRDHIAAQIAMLPPHARVLELGCSPGLLAHRVLQQCPDLETYTLMDFSRPMLALSRKRLAAFPAASFVYQSLSPRTGLARSEVNSAASCLCKLSTSCGTSVTHDARTSRSTKFSPPPDSSWSVTTLRLE
jgi:hypothetical protein